ncbi:MAG: tetratricopeptide repeat protein [Planctomycetes bacterium]|nr:tetratricopeptide repeat protein [Planctomycetota bacterium]
MDRGRSAARAAAPDAVSAWINHRYQVLRALGRGGMGTVFLVADAARDGMRLALKALRGTHRGEKFASHFKQEFVYLTQLRHPNIAAVHDFGVVKAVDAETGVVAGEYFYTQEYIPGSNLHRYSEAKDWDCLYELLVQVCRGLAYIHSRDVVHHDIKPGNILVMEGEGAPWVKLIDFGLAGERGPSSGVVKGTLNYIAPEVLQGRPVDRRADLYSLGVTFYQAVTRTLPFGNVPASGLIRAHLGTPPESPVLRRADCPPPFAELLVSLMEKEPSRRPESANAVIRAVQRVAGRAYAQDTAATVESYVLSGRFVGREAELARLLAIFDELVQVGASGRPGSPAPVVLVAGEGGVGRSRLVAEFKTQVQLGRVAFVEGSSPPGGGPAYGPFREALAQLLPAAGVEGPALGTPVPGEAGPGHAEGVEAAVPSPEAYPLDETVHYVAAYEGPDGESPGPEGPRCARGGVPPGGVLVDGYAPELARLVPHLIGERPSHALEPEQERRRLIESVGEFLIELARARPYVLHLADLHRADEETLELVVYLGRNLRLAQLRSGEGAPPRCMVVATARGDEPASTDVAARLAPLARDGALEVVRLARLPEPRVAELVDGMIHLPAREGLVVAHRVFEHSGGNPFFIVEVMRDLVATGVLVHEESGWRLDAEALGRAEIPRGVKEVFRTRLARLPEEAQALCADLAVARRATLEDLDAVGVRTDSYFLVRALERQEILSRVAGAGAVRWEFATELMREAVLDSMDPARRRATHRAMARRLVEVATEGAGEDLQAIADHFEGAGDAARTVAYSVRAAHGHRSVYAHAKAVSCLQAALRLVSGTSGLEAEAGVRAHLLREELADVLGHLGRHAEAEAHYRALLEDAEVAADPSRWARIARKLGDGRETRGEYDGALEDYRRGLRRLGPGARGEEAALLAAGMATVHVRRGDYEEASLRCLEALARSPEGADGPTASIYHTRGRLRFRMGDYEAAASDWRKARTLCERSGELVREADVLSNLGNVFLIRGQPAAAIDHYHRSLRLRERIGDTPGRATALNNMGTAWFDRGEVGRALACFEEALDIHERSGNLPGVAAALNNVGMVHAHRSEYPRSIECRQRSLELREELGDAEGAAKCLVDLGHVHTLRGEYAHASRCYEGALGHIDPSHHREVACLSALGLAQLAVLLHDVEAVGRWVDLGEAFASGLGLAYLEAEIQALRGDLLRMGGDPEGGSRELEAAVARFDAIEHVGDAAGARLRLAACRLDLRDLERALALVEAAYEMAERARSSALSLEAMIGCAECVFLCGDLASAEYFLLKARDLSEGLGLPEQRWRFQACLGRCHRARGDRAAALAAHVSAMEILRALWEAAPAGQRDRFLSAPGRRAVREELRELAER